QHYFSVKTILFIFAVPLALCAAVGATAQTRSAVTMPKMDTVILSKTTDGNYNVCRYVVRSESDEGYALHFKINTSQLVPTFDGNTKEMQALCAFLGATNRDSLMSVRGVTITGYASPDGVVAQNNQLAQHRAQSLKTYVDQKYDLSKRYKVTTAAVASDWSAARAAVVASDIPHKQQVLNIIDQRDAAPMKEKKLRALPAAWRYMVSKILPAMRYADVMIDYSKGQLVVQRTLIEHPQPAPQVVAVPQPKCCCRGYVFDNMGIVVEMRDVATDFRRKADGREKLEFKEKIDCKKRGEYKDKIKFK
ncbi:MAG: hypothetical protein RR971_04575, partial [Alistipes sp.]